jgi:hypothetical protein
MITDNKSLQLEFRQYLSPGGEGYERNPALADHHREQVAWAMIELLENGRDWERSFWGQG